MSMVVSMVETSGPCACLPSRPFGRGAFACARQRTWPLPSSQSPASGALRRLACRHEEILLLGECQHRKNDPEANEAGDVAPAPVALRHVGEGARPIRL